MKLFFRVILFLGVIIIFLFVLKYAGLVFTPAGISSPINQEVILQNETPLACIGEYCFKIELAQTQEEFYRGLMFREHLDQDKGMLFVFGVQGTYPFWMKNTLIPLDIIWVDNSYKIVFIKKDAQPCQDGQECLDIVPSGEASYVLEINAGLSDQLDFNAGDVIEIK